MNKKNDLDQNLIEMDLKIVEWYKEKNIKLDQWIAEEPERVKEVYRILKSVNAGEKIQQILEKKNKNNLFFDFNRKNFIREWYLQKAIWSNFIVREQKNSERKILSHNLFKLTPLVEEKQIIIQANEKTRHILIQELSKIKKEKEYCPPFNQIMMINISSKITINKKLTFTINIKK